MQPDYQMPPVQPQQPVPPQGPGMYPTGSDMGKHHSRNWWMIATIGVTLLFFGAIGLGFWALNDRNHFRDDTLAIVDNAVEEAVAENTANLEADFMEREKEPLKTYTGPSAHGTIKIEYPKTWSAQINESGSSSKPLEGFFHPGFVPHSQMDRPYALHLEVIGRAFDSEVGRYDSAVNRGNLQSRPITLENVPGVTGTRLDGQISSDREGSIVLFPLRDKTLVMTVEATRYRNDFNNIILKNLEFNP